MQKLLEIDSLPLPVEESTEEQTFEFAQETIALLDDKNGVLSMVRDEIIKRENTDVQPYSSDSAS